MLDLLELNEDYVKSGLDILGVKCPMCKSKEWVIAGWSERVKRIDEKDKKGDDIVVAGVIHIPIHFLKVKCVYCGFVAEFDHVILEKVARDEEEEYSGSPIGLQGKEDAPLTEMQKKFVLEYIKSGNRTEAALKAGYPNVTVEANATTLMCSRKIINAIKEERRRIRNERDAEIHIRKQSRSIF